MLVIIVSVFRKAFLLWNTAIQEDLQVRYKLADEFNKYRVVSTCFHSWTKVTSDSSTISYMCK